MISFNVPPFTGKELEYMKKAVDNKKYVEMGNLQLNAADGWKVDFMQIVSC